MVEILTFLLWVLFIFLVIKKDEKTQKEWKSSKNYLTADYLVKF